MEQIGIEALLKCRKKGDSRRSKSLLFSTVWLNMLIVIMIPGDDHKIVDTLRIKTISTFRVITALYLIKIFRGLSKLLKCFYRHVDVI